MTESKPTKLLM